MKHIKLLLYIKLICVILYIFFFIKAFAYQANYDSFLNIPENEWFDNSVYITTLQNNRKILVWWEFTTYDWISANKIVRLFSDGRRDTSFIIGSWFNDAVRAITVQDDGKIIVWWHFTNYNWVTANRIIRLNPDWSVDNSFVIWSGFNAQVRTIALQEDGKMIVGWAIVNYNWANIYRIVRLNTNGSIDTSFNVWLGFNNNIRSIAFQEDGKIILGGWFVVYNWTTTNRIIRINPDGSRDNSFVIWSGFNEQINMVAIQPDGKILVGGLFTGYNWTLANRIARLNSNGSIDASFNMWNWFDAQVVSLMTYNNKIIIGWAFDFYNGTSINKLVRLNNDWSIDTSFNVWIGYNNTVRSFGIQTDGKILVWWDFTWYQSASFWRLMRLHGDSNVSLLDTNNEDAIHAEFLSKWYIVSQSILSWSAPMVFIDTEWKVPVQLKLKNKGILLTLPKNVEIKKSSNMTNYTWVFYPPNFIANSKSGTIATIQAGYSSIWLSLINWLATLSIPVDDVEAWNLVEIFYSEDNGDTWFTHTKTFVNKINGKSYASFMTDHFTDFAISSPLAMMWSFLINNDSSTTTSENVTLNISTTPPANQMRFSNDGLSWSTREAYTTSKSWTLTAGYGSKTVYAEFDIDGDNTADVQTSDSISYNNVTCWSWPGSKCVVVEILWWMNNCEFNNYDFMSTWFSYWSQILDSNIPTYICDMEEWSTNSYVSIQSSNLENPNVTVNIPATNIRAKHVSMPNILQWMCDIDNELANTYTDISSVDILFSKDDYTVCSVWWSTQLQITVPAALPVWLYTWDIVFIIY